MPNPLGSAPGIMVGVGVGTAAAAALEPLIEPGRQAAWGSHPNRVLDPGLYARLVAQGAIAIDVGRPLARRSGFNEDQFNRLVHLAQSAPDLADTLELWRRKKISEPLVDHALAKAQIEHQYWEGLKELFNARLSPQVAALAIVRGIMKDPGFLPVGPPSTEGKVKAFPVSPLDPLYEAQGWGYDKERMFVETAIAGRPMGPEAAAAAVFRDILDRVDYDRAIAEGDVRNEWADAIFETARQIPSVADYVALHLRGHTDAAGMHTGAARHGMSAADADRIYLARGRPAAPGQMATAAARGIDGPNGTPMNRAQFLLGIAESDIRPEWGPMLWDARFLYPPLFQLTRLVQGQAIDADTAAEWARKDRYPPEVVTALHAYWLTLKPAAEVSQIAKLATTQARAALKKRYLVEHIDTAGVLSGLELLGSDAAEAGHILEMWTLEKGWLIKLLTPAQIKKAYRGGELTQDEAIAGLVEQHYNVPDATLYLTE